MKWTLEQRPIKELFEYAKNARRLNKEQAEHLQTSLSKFGQCEPIVINTDNIIIGGHQRLRTLKKLKEKEVDVYVPDRTLTDKEVEELNIRLNKNVGDWDWDMLGNAWDETDLLDWGFTESDLGFEVNENSDIDKENKKSAFKVTITFKELEHLQEANDRIDDVIQKFPGVKKQVKIG